MSNGWGKRFKQCGRAGLAIACGMAATLFCPAISPQNLDLGTRLARASPSWVRDLTIYEVWLNAFSAEGTLRGAIPHLQDVKDLGASMVYLGPIAKRSSKPYASPYNIADYNAIDPQYGTEADFRAFVAAAHGLGLKVMLDIVYYHTAPDGVMAQHPGWLVHTEEGKLARGFWPQPLPNFEKPEVRKYLIDSLVHWVRDLSVDGFRCDVGGGVPVSFWNEARRALDAVNRDVVLLSESDRPDDQLEAFDINYDFAGYLALRAVLREGEPAIKIREHWEEAKRRYPRGARLLRFTDNHDWRRAVLQFGDRGAMLAAALSFTLDGIPFVYNGQEIGDGTPTHWLTQAPIPWPDHTDRSDRKTVTETLDYFRNLFAMRAAHPALRSGEVTWVNNSEPASVLSFLRRAPDEEILVVLNASNRRVNVTLDLPVMEGWSVENLLEEKETHFPLYSGRVSTELDGFGVLVGKRRPREALEEPK